MISQNVVEPDVTLLLDATAVIRNATVSHLFDGEDVGCWIGQSWSETVTHIDDGDRVRRAFDEAQHKGVSSFQQVVQRFPSGHETPIEYNAIRLGGGGDVIAVGKNLRAVAELQSRLVEAQQALEKDYWRLREVETRYRLLFNHSSDAIVLLRETSLAVVEMNPAAARILGLPPHLPKTLLGRDFLPSLPAEERGPFRAMLLRVRDQGKAPATVLRLGPSRTPCTVHASLMSSDPGRVYLVHLSSINSSPETSSAKKFALAPLLDRSPDGFVVIDREGHIVKTNRALLDMLQLAAEAPAVGQPLGRWLGRPGADLTVLLANVERLGMVRLFATTLNGELGTETEVELSAVADDASNPRFIGVFVRDIDRRLTVPSTRLTTSLGSLAEQVGRKTLRKLVDETVHLVEHHYIEAALELTGGNRTAAAEILGLSRQGLYAKLHRHEHDNAESPAAHTQES